MKPARSATGFLGKLVWFSLVGFAIWGVFRLLVRRSEKSKAAEREGREARAKAIAQKRSNPAPDKPLKSPSPEREFIDMHQKAQDFLAALDAGLDLTGGLAFRRALQQSRLDYSMESLDRVEKLLNQIRSKYSPQRESWNTQAGADNFCLMLAFYLGEMISRQANQPIKWHTREQAAA